MKRFVRFNKCLGYVTVSVTNILEYVVVNGHQYAWPDLGDLNVIECQSTTLTTLNVVIPILTLP